MRRNEYDEKTSALTQPELIIHVTEASCVVLPVPEEVQLSILASEENLRRIDFHECHNSFTITITSTAEVAGVLSVTRQTGDHILFDKNYGFRMAFNWIPAG